MTTYIWDQKRPATDVEIVDGHAWDIRYDRKVQFRHFLSERYSPRAKNGVSHHEYSRSRLYVVDGVPHVRHHGRLQAVSAYVVPASDGVGSCMFDLRIRSEYLR